MFIKQFRGKNTKVSDLSVSPNMHAEWQEKTKGKIS